MNVLRSFSLLCLLGLGAASAQAAYQLGDIFASVGGGQVRRYNSAGVLQQTLNTTQGGFTTGSAFDSAGNFFVTNFSSQSLSKFDNNGNLLNGAFASGFNSSPESIVFDASGNFYVGQADGSADIRKYNSAGVLLTSYNVATTARGSDWIDLAANQTTMFYTSENFEIKRFDLATNTQLPDFANGGARPKFALRILGDGGVLVAASSVVERYNAAGVLTQTYDPIGSNSFALNLDPDGTSFWTGDYGNGNLYKYDIASGNLLATINTGAAGSLFGVSIYGEITQGGGGGQVPEPSSVALLAGVALFAVRHMRHRQAS